MKAAVFALGTPAGLLVGLLLAEALAGRSSSLILGALKFVMSLVVAFALLLTGYYAWRTHFYFDEEEDEPIPQLRATFVEVLGAAGLAAVGALLAGLITARITR
jgi:hypothetical protein